ncbi:hypothetical protein N8979_00995, partial [bacterium]|nr:hypothetical protein [bacterium]
IMASLDRVEIANYAFEVEYACRLHALGGMTTDATVALIRMLIDGRLYTNMMGRDVNFRYSDLSSAFNTPNKLRYFKRIFGPGDMAVPAMIERENPILNLTTHDMCQVGGPLFDALGERLVFINVVRHPLFMIIQQTLNMERLLNDARDIQVYFEYQGQELPYFATGWEDLYLASNAVEKAVYVIQHQEELRQEVLQKYRTCLGHRYIEIPFERFVKDPGPYLDQICKASGTAPGRKTATVMRGQKVPRKNVVDGISLAIYKRCGWEAPVRGLNECEEHAKRRQFAVDQGASDECLNVLDSLSREYELKNSIL